jgi:MFS transporter, CP family, cyanate transporter
VKVNSTSTSSGRTPEAAALSPALILAGLLLVAANLRAGITTVGPVLVDLQRDLHLSSLSASALISLPLLAFAVISPVTPRLAARLGLERTLALGLAVLAVGLAVRSVPPLALLWLGTALLGVAIAVLNVALPALVKRDFPQKIGQITGVYSAVQSIFAAIAAGVAVPVAHATDLGWRIPLGMWAGLALIGLGVLAPQLRRHTVAPADVRVDLHHPTAAGWSSPWRSALGWQVTAFMGLQATVFYVIITWLPAIERAAGLSQSAAGLHQFVLNGSAIFGSIACSALLPRMRDQRLLAVGTPVVMFAATVGIYLTPALASIWTALIGVAGGVGIVLALSFFGLRTRNHLQAAELSGMAQSVGYLVAAAGPIIVGASHDWTASWTPALVTLMVLQALLAIFGYLAGRNRVVD